jgi:NAD(P)-dependent dehydrogenase (short-subunit alcohol dehydrogenase family)
MGRTFLVTGASTGFGRALTESLAAKGHTVFAGARKQKDIDALAAIPNVKALRLDVNVQQDVDAAAGAVSAAERGLDGLVNNAGVAVLSSIGEALEEDVRYQMDANVFGVWRVTRAMLPLLIASKGRVVNTSSMSGIVSQKLLGFYCMSKHAVEAFTDALAGEMEPFGVSVSAIEPGNFATEVGQTWADRLTSRGGDYTHSPYRQAAEITAERLRSKEGKEGPARVVAAMEDALLGERPKGRYLVVSGQRDAEVALRGHIKRLVQFNQEHESSFGRDELIRMLDEASAALARGSA